MPGQGLRESSQRTRSESGEPGVVSALAGARTPVNFGRRKVRGSVEASIGTNRLLPATYTWRPAIPRNLKRSKSICTPVPTVVLLQGSSVDNEKDDHGSNDGYGQDNQWEGKKILDRRVSGSGFAYYVSWVTRENDSNDTSWEPRSGIRKTASVSWSCSFWRFEQLR